MNEIITVNGVKYTVHDVSTAPNNISFVVEKITLDEAEEIFKNVTALTVAPADNDADEYGDYPHIEFASISKDADGNITVTMHILTQIELQIKDLQTTQAEQDEAIAEMLFGGMQYDE
jgi:hypothetical protein